MKRLVFGLGASLAVGLLSTTGVFASSLDYAKSVGQVDMADTGNFVIEATSDGGYVVGGQTVQCFKQAWAGPVNSLDGNLKPATLMAQPASGYIRKTVYGEVAPMEECADDIDKLRQIMVSHGSTAQIIAKIETKKAVQDDETMEAIVKATDGVMVARGDLAYEAGAEIVPIVQRKLIALCRQYSKLCIVATQMMSSMVDNPRPTRAEVSDVATAVLLGADVVMLSDETANGKYPIETVKEMKKVILYTQDHSRILPLDKETTGNYQNYDAISRALYLGPYNGGYDRLWRLKERRRTTAIRHPRSRGRQCAVVGRLKRYANLQPAE